jgi:hypothetical protein
MKNTKFGQQQTLYRVQHCKTKKSQVGANYFMCHAQFFLQSHSKMAKFPKSQL